MPVEPRADDAVESPAASTSVLGVRCRPARRASRMSRSACRSLAVFGAWAGWGLPSRHVLRGMSAGRAGRRSVTGWCELGRLASYFAVLAFVLAGWGVAVLSRLTAAVDPRISRAGARLSDELSMQASGRRSAGTDRRDPGTTWWTGGSSPAPDLERARSMAEIVRAAAAADWVEARDAIA